MLDQIGAAAREYAVANYSWNAKAQRIKSLYQNLLEKEQ
jgi:glycosyltransferase involved in cell wall biosynthesis